MDEEKLIKLKEKYQEFCDRGITQLSENEIITMKEIANKIGEHYLKI